MESNLSRIGRFVLCDTSPKWRTVIIAAKSVRSAISQLRLLRKLERNGFSLKVTW